jgi:hypothetical protein
VEATLNVLNELEREGVFQRYAIGGAVGAIFCMEPLLAAPHVSPWLKTRSPSRRSKGAHAKARRVGEGELMEKLLLFSSLFRGFA